MATVRELFRFLDEHIFLPILNATPDGRDRQTLRLAQAAVERTRMEYQQIDSVDAMRAAFISDLRSESGRLLAERLRWLGLPRFEDIEAEFLRLADEGQ